MKLKQKSAQHELNLPRSCRPFVWSDLEWLSAAWRACIERYDLAQSNYSAINAWLFRKEHGFYVFEHDPPFLIEPLPDRNRMIPTCFPVQWDSAFFEAWFGKPCTLYPITDSWLYHFPEEQYLITRSDSESDYLYRKETLSLLKGRHLSSRRNLLHQLTREHQIIIKPLTCHNVPDAKQILDAWQTHYQQQHTLPQTDYAPCLEALNKLCQLSLNGQIAYAGETPIGFYLGERLSSRVYLLHFLKELFTFHGVAPLLYQACAQHQEDEVEWLNLEQDLGLPGLKKAKQAYQPDHLLLKWEIKNR